jgi:hypothetical protein
VAEDEVQTRGHLDHAVEHREAAHRIQLVGSVTDLVPVSDGDDPETGLFALAVDEVTQQRDIPVLEDLQRQPHPRHQRLAEREERQGRHVRL